MLDIKKLREQFYKTRATISKDEIRQWSKDYDARMAGSREEEARQEAEKAKTFDTHSFVANWEWAIPPLPFATCQAVKENNYLSVA